MNYSKNGRNSDILTVLHLKTVISCEIKNVQRIEHNRCACFIFKVDISEIYDAYIRLYMHMVCGMHTMHKGDTMVHSK